MGSSNKNIITNFLDKMENNLSWVFSVCLTAFIFLGISFLPSSYLQKVHMLEFFKQWTWLIILILLFSFFLLIGSLKKPFDNWKNQRIGKKQQRKILSNPSEDELELLKKLYTASPNAIPVVRTNLIIQELQALSICIQTSNQSTPLFDNPNDVSFYYALNPYFKDKVGIVIEKSNKTKE